MSVSVIHCNVCEYRRETSHTRVMGAHKIHWAVDFFFVLGNHLPMSKKSYILQMFCLCEQAYVTSYIETLFQYLFYSQRSRIT